MIFHPGDFGRKRVVRSKTTVWRRGRQSIQSYRVRWVHRTAEDTDHDCDRLFCCGAHTCSCETRFGPVRGWTVEVLQNSPNCTPHGQVDNRPLRRGRDAKSSGGFGSAGEWRYFSGAGCASFRPERPGHGQLHCGTGESCHAGNDHAVYVRGPSPCRSPEPARPFPP
jgi:hypothetical protein